MKTVKTIDSSTDFDAWRAIWEASTSGQLSDAVTQNTWQNLIDENMPLFGMMAYAEDGTAVGLLHYALHITSGAIEPAVYMQDLFVLEHYRRRGFARLMMKAFLTKGQQDQWDRVIWLVQKDNEAADKFYGEFATKLDFDFYIHGIAMLKRLMN